MKELEGLEELLRDIIDFVPAGKYRVELLNYANILKTMKQVEGAEVIARAEAQMTMQEKLDYAKARLSSCGHEESDLWQERLQYLKEGKE